MAVFGRVTAVIIDTARGFKNRDESFENSHLK
jgi:hypothetical protein